MRLGVFGGTFNPIHLGHLRAAEEVGEALDLDRIRFVPARLPPHKSDDALAPAGVRLELVELAVAGNPRFEVSDVELVRDGPSYSVDTLSALGGEGELWFLLGVDAFRELPTWHRYRDLLARTHLAVMGRPPHGGPIRPPRALAHEFDITAEGYLHRETGSRVRVVPVTALDISSSHIRRCLDRGASIRYLVPETVAGAIGRHRTHHPTWFSGSPP